MKIVDVSLDQAEQVLHDTVDQACLSGDYPLIREYSLQGYRWSTERYVLRMTLWFCGGIAVNVMDLTLLGALHVFSIIVSQWIQVRISLHVCAKNDVF